MPMTAGRLGKVSLLMLTASLAPTSSEGDAASTRERLAARAVLARATALAARQTFLAVDVQSWAEDAIRAHAEALEDRRVAEEIDAEAAGLVPGRFVWRPERASAGAVDVVVSLEAQRAYVFRERKLIAVTTVSTGRSGHETPAGVFPILQKKRIHHSNLYDDAPMPNMQRLTWDGVALHAGAVRARPASHGCVRLPAAFSNLLYGITRIGSVVRIVHGTPSSPSAALAEAAQLGAR